MKRYTIALDPDNDPALLTEYEHWQKVKNGGPGVKKSMEDGGIASLEICRAGNRLLLIMETEDHFSFEQQYKVDVSNFQVQEWEQLRWKFQQPLPGAAEGEKYVVLNISFELHHK